MKKVARMLMGLALALMLGTGALAQDEGTIVQSSCNIVQSGEYYLVYCFAQVHNNTQETICLDEGNLYVMSGEDAIGSERMTRLWPSFLAPGQDGYLFNIVTFEPGGDGAGMPAVTGLSYDLSYMTVNPAYGGQALDAQARIEVDDVTGYMSVVCEIDNTTDEDAFGAVLAIGLYTDAGQMVYADGLKLNDVGIPAGGRVLVRFDVDEELAQQWRSYDALPTQAHVNVMFSTNED
ncbi:MAG: hypothetical protein ACI4MM_07080 [Candidatus Ventricola sp.]